jgi:multidrug efflux pump subunit AcrA (membrane-fusion protein)
VLVGVVALEAIARPQRELAAILRQLQWGAAGIEVLSLRTKMARSAAGRERLQTALDLVTSAFGHPGFFAAASAFVTTVATRLECDEAKVTVVDRVVDAASGTFGVRLELPNPGYKLPAGLKCKTRFPVK